MVGNFSFQNRIGLNGPHVYAIYVKTVIFHTRFCKYSYFESYRYSSQHKRIMHTKDKPSKTAMDHVIREICHLLVHFRFRHFVFRYSLLIFVLSIIDILCNFRSKTNSYLELVGVCWRHHIRY